MKRNFYSVTVFFFVAILWGCSKEDRNAKKLYRHQGRWTIDHVIIQTFDSTGAKLIDSTVTAPGELVMMRTGSLNALFDYRQGVFIISDSLGNHGYFFEYYFDGNRITIGSCGAPFAINGTYTSVIDNSNEQQWEIYSAGFSTLAPTSLTGKFIMHLIRSKD